MIVKLSDKIYAMFFGAILTLSLSPIKISIAAFISCISFFILLKKYTTVKSNIIIGYFYGLGFFITSISWIYNSIFLFTESIFVSSCITGSFILILSLFFSFFSCLTIIFTNRTDYSIILSYPVIWVFMELIRSFLCTGFPWVLLGYSQTNNFIGSYAKFGSVFLVGFITCLISSLVMLIMHDFKKIKYYIIIFLILILGELINLKDFTKHSDERKSVTIVQGNYKQNNKWDPDKLNDIMNYYYDATLNNPANLIFWPEASIPAFKKDVKKFLEKLNNLGISNNSAILLGILDNNRRGEYFNAAFTYGNASGIYYKIHLVPFGEYYPSFFFLNFFALYLNIPTPNFSQGQSSQRSYVIMDNIKVAPFICYEISYPFMVRNRSKSSNLIALLSDDGWFGNSLAPWQHEEISQMRAIETGRYLIQATNNGITSIINPKGEIIDRIEQDTQGVLKGTIYPMKGYTPWSKYGTLLLNGIILIFMLSNITLQLYIEYNNRLNL